MLESSAIGTEDALDGTAGQAAPASRATYGMGSTPAPPRDKLAAVKASSVGQSARSAAPAHLAIGRPPAEFVAWPALLASTALLCCAKSEPERRGATDPAASVSGAVSGPKLEEKRRFPPPYEPFTLTEWRQPLQKDAPATRPTKDLLFPWYVIVDQKTPRPKKNYQWTELPAERGGELEMPSGSAWKCIYNPVRFVAQTDRDDERITGWAVVRPVRCTTDGWATYVEGAHGVIMSLDGKRTLMSKQMELFLRDRLGQKLAEITVLMRSDDPRPKPTKGPGWKSQPGR